MVLTGSELNYKLYHPLSRSRYYSKYEAIQWMKSKI